MWLESHQQFALTVVGLLAFTEACFGIGLFVSGLFLATVSTWLYTNNLATLWQILPIAFVGAFAGDHVGFYLGRWFGHRFHQLTFVTRHAAAFSRAETIIAKRGGVAIFVGRLVPAIRSLVPAILGVSGYERYRFSILDAIACLVWITGLGVIIAGIDNLL